MTNLELALNKAQSERNLNFDVNLREQLGIYVYALIDPRPEYQGVFYIGKAGGSGAGNERIKHHFDEAIRAIKSTGNVEHASLSLKIRRFLDIWVSGYEVDWAIIRRNIASEEEAFALEGAVIDALTKVGGHQLTNLQHGHNFKEAGFLGREAVLCLSAPVFDASLVPNSAIGRNVFLFSIKNTLRGEANPNDDDIFQATHSAWTIAEKWRISNGSLAIGLIEGISVGIYAIEKWHLKEGYEGKQKKYQKWKFSRSSIDESIKESMHRKNFSGLLKEAGNWGRGGRVIFTISSGKTADIVCGKSNIK